MDGLPAWLPFPPLFLALWIGISAFLSWFGGWAVLARTYRLMGEFTGRRWRFRSAVVCNASPLRHVSYGSCVTVGANGRGLYLAVLPLFRIGHPPLFVPWADVHLARHDWLCFSYLELRCRRAEGVLVRLPRRLGQEVAAVGGLAVPT